MKRFVIILFAAIAGFVVFAFCGYWMITFLSSNTHDRAVESAMTSIFVLGPLGAVLGVLAGTWFSKPKGGSL
jgi:membrane-bound acyltransferase YfiQ involved in biofilm formation